MTSINCQNGELKNRNLSEEKKTTTSTNIPLLFYESRNKKLKKIGDLMRNVGNTAPVNVVKLKNSFLLQ